MAWMRCPQCNTPLTEEEIRDGECLMCSAKIDAPAASVPSGPPAPPRAAPPPSMTAALLWAVGGVLAFCLLPVGFMVYNMWPDPPAQSVIDNPEAKGKSALAATKKPPIPKTVAKKQRTTSSAKTQEPKVLTQDSATKQAEPKPPEKKKDEPKKIEPKKVEVAKKPDPPKPAPVAQRQGFTSVPLLADSRIQIDGDLADWKGVTPILLHGLQRGQAVKKPVIVPKTQKAFLGYSSKGLLIAVEVVDTSGVLENAEKPAVGMWPFWDNDAIEVYIDTFNKRPERRGDANLHQFFAFPFGTPRDARMGGYESRILSNRAGRDAWTIVPLLAGGKNGMQRAGKKTADGWTMELLIPKSALRFGAVKPGQRFGFELQIDTGTNIFYFWANDNPRTHVSMAPNAWGEIQFAGTDAGVEVLGPGKLAAKTIVAGQPLLIRVTDLDRNLEPLRREKVDVQVTTKSGERTTVLLTESTPNSGVFLGAVRTRLKTGRRMPNVLDVVPGETLTVEFLDLHRADGQINRIVRTDVTVKAK
ncbi:MAG: hypothetical protein HYX68_11935 [Planctomycetes bacterium]|nr:hypothetical protein [Planctomycetota bacterium]